MPLSSGAWLTCFAQRELMSSRCRRCLYRSAGVCAINQTGASSNMRIEFNGNGKNIDISIFVLRGFSACCWRRRACVLV